MKNRNFISFILLMLLILYFLIFDNYGVLKYISLNNEIKKIEEKKNFILAKQILYKERIKFLKSDLGKRLKKYF
ncbi:MAG: hypothetical protein ABIN20_03680 [candidate division WOR-3 bacterium]